MKQFKSEVEKFIQLLRQELADPRIPNKPQNLDHVPMSSQKEYRESINGFPSPHRITIYEDVLKYYNKFQVPQWVEVPLVAIQFFCLPLVMPSENSSSKVYEFPAHWYFDVTVRTDLIIESKLNVFVQSESQLDVLKITVQEWFACRKNQAVQELVKRSPHIAETCGPNCDGKACRPCPPYAGQDIVKLLATFNRLKTQSWDMDGYMRETGVDIRLVYSGTYRSPRVYVKVPFYKDMKPMEPKHYRPVNTDPLTTLVYDYEDIDRRLKILEQQS